MKKQIAAIIVSIAAVFVLTAVSAKAQSNQKMTVNIPFEFAIAGETYAAGKYTIGRLNEQKPGMLILKRKEGAAMKMFLTQNLRSKTRIETARIVFSNSGGSYSLSEIWTGGVEGGRQILAGGNERRSERFAKTADERIILPALLQ